MTGNLIQGAVFTMMVVRIGDPRSSEFAVELGRQIALSPRFFDNAPVVLDLRDNLGFLDAAEFHDAIALLRRHNMLVVGVQNASASQKRAAASVGLASFVAQTPARRPVAETVAAERPARAESPAPPPPPAAPATAQGRAKIVTHPIRSGAQIYARGGDLIVLNSVSAGAEIIADGNIHVYGTLRGRAIAGATGDAEARIFASRLEAELISVAGRYLVSDNIAPDYRGQAVQVALHEDRLTIMKN